MTQPPGQPHQWWQPQPPGSGGPPHPGPQGHSQAPGPPYSPGYGGTFSSEYGGFGAFDNSSPAKRGKSRKPWVIGAAVLVVLSGAGGVTAWLTGAFTGEVLDQAALHEGVASVLTDSYGEHDVANVRCPADQQITTGHTFDCTVDVAGSPRTVSIRILNDEPQYEVGAPR
ncbi:DUF4333 domain-containing protein [Saccharomonospora piscinae]|uniref:DUF4333 domain-containing protein n=1 Tax=Saccharomonospora piscinae TaxID=687388 RepID=UPI001106B34E|nr:DUF4333 domain-containing protein [Saccharomonospora piscinae]TLW93801.1 DUF4333 domain-containing protein [Saccharomonospora piscinae]